MNTDMKKLINLWLLLITLDFSACGSSQSPNEPIFSETQTEKPVALNKQPQSPQIKVSTLRQSQKQRKFWNGNR